MKKQLPVVFLAMMALAASGGCGGDEDASNMNEQPGDKGYSDVDAATAKMMIDTMPELVVIDVSPVWDQGHLPGAVSLPLGSGALDQAIPTLDKNTPYLVYCHGDEPSMRGASKLVAAGFGMVYRLAGNYAAWVNAGYPIEM